MASATRWTRLNWPHALPGVALALAAVLAAAGCASASARTASLGNHPSAGPPAITAAQARAVFDAYVATTARASRTGDTALALSVVTGVARVAVTTAAKEARFLGAKPSLAPYSYRKPAFYLPRQDGYPRFFVASALREPAGDPGQATAREPVAGIIMPRNGTALLLFEQESATATWQLASVSVLPPGTTMPRLATGEGGAIAQVPLSSTALLARPDVAGPLQAAVMDDGPTSASARAVAAGPLTTGMYHVARDHALGLRPPSGDAYQWELEGSNLPKFTLRTAGGGALVFYAMYLNVTVAVPGYVNGANPIEPGLPISYPKALNPWVSPTSPAPRVRVEEQQLLSFAAVDPPPGNGKIQVIAIGGALDYAAAS